MTKLELKALANRVAGKVAGVKENIALTRATYLEPSWSIMDEPEELTESQKKEKRAAQKKSWRQANLERIRAHQRDYDRLRRARRKAEGDKT